MLITTGETKNGDLVTRAMKLAEETGSLYVPRNKTSLARLAEKYNDDEIIVVVSEGVRLIRRNEPELSFHPSMGYVRAKRVLRGEDDPMLSAGAIKEGDTVLDCTAGLGTDSLVFAVAVGKSGHVIACESSLPLYTLLLEGMKYYKAGKSEVNDALRSIELKNKDHLSLLQEMEDKSVDVVYFDPMFREPMLDSSGIKPLRAFANSNALQKEAIDEARRVARKRIVMKEKAGSDEFRRLGFPQPERSRSKIVYGVIELDNEQ